MLSKTNSLNNLLRHAAVAASSRYLARAALDGGTYRAESSSPQSSPSPSPSNLSSPRALLATELLQRRGFSSSSPSPLGGGISASASSWSADDVVVTDANNNGGGSASGEDGDEAKIVIYSSSFLGGDGRDRRMSFLGGDDRDRRRRKNDTLAKVLKEKLAEMRSAGTYKRERVIGGPQGAEILVVEEEQHDDDDEGGNNEGEEECVVGHERSSSTKTQPQPQTVLNFCANNYLGLSNHPALVEAAKRALDTHGHGLSSVRFICGTQDIHRRLERKIAAFHGTDDAILYPSCFDANAGMFEAILTEAGLHKLNPVYP
jgi:hypothetical protein